ncbi:MAG: hypothetical protein IKQ06_05100 [Bacilli bacterium]|nr:hypothetical protein [Bacilli bacterium]MBR6137514.1 hypothetical protein [Bacilli bacterium]
MAIEKYQGKYVIAEDALKVIDMPTINNGCRMLKDASEKLENLSKKIEVLKDLINRDSLSVSDSNMEAIIEEYEKRTRDFSLYINDLSETVNTTTQRVVNRKQVIFNEEAKRLDEQEALLHLDTTPQQTTDMGGVLNEGE